MTSTIDGRGYSGPERNRQMTPEQVIWARTNYHAGRISVREMVPMFGMSAESIRRMLRGETYGNIGAQLPRADDPPRATPIGQDLEAEAQASLKRVAQAVRSDEPDLAGLEDDPFAPPSGDAAVEAFLKGDKK